MVGSCGRCSIVVVDVGSGRGMLQVVIGVAHVDEQGVEKCVRGVCGMYDGICVRGVCGMYDGICVRSMCGMYDGICVRGVCGMYDGICVRGVCVMYDGYARR